MKHTGGGWYVLSNGEKVRGKQAAEAAEAKLQGGSTSKRNLAKVDTDSPTADPNKSRYGNPYAKVAEPE